MSGETRFEGPVQRDAAGGYVVLPFDPAPGWGERDVYRIGGTANGQRWRGLVQPADGEWRVRLTPMWMRDCGLEGATNALFVVHLEGPQRADLDPDFAQALAAEPGAAAFWDNLAQFYRKAYLTWISGTKRRPDERACRIAETVRLLKAGVKARP